jgi:hypothetical protein
MHCSAPIEQIDIRNGLETLETVRPYKEQDLGRRIRVIWGGSEYRGRGRETIWNGSATLKGNSFEQTTPINRYNLDKIFEQSEAGLLQWESITTGGHAGFEARLSDATSGILSIDTNLVKADIAIADIGFEAQIFEAGGLGRRLRVFRMPDENPHKTCTLSKKITLADDRDNALYVRIIQEDGHVIWSSPIYIFR